MPDSLGFGRGGITLLVAPAPIALYQSRLLTVPLERFYLRRLVLRSLLLVTPVLCRCAYQSPHG